MQATIPSVSDRIMRRARGTGRGGVFTSSDFLDMAARAAVDQALSRLVKNGKLRRLARGLYFPKVHPKLGPLSPTPDDVAQALARETGSHVQISGIRAANALGLTTQAPARSTAPGSAAGTVVQALRHVGPVRAADVVQVAARRLSVSDKKTLASSAVQAPAWMRPTLVSIANAAVSDIDG